MSEAVPPPPLLLALDTATSVASLGIYDGERVLAETTWVAGREHSAQLLAEVDRALVRTGRTVAHLTGMVVARGPGSFTGVRVALSVAKGMAAALDIPLWGVDTLDVLAHAAGIVDLPVRPVVDAGRGRVATALYRNGQCVEAMRGASMSELMALIHEPTVVLGDLSAEARRALASETPARVMGAAGSLRRAGYLAELGWRAAAAGDPGDPTGLEAVYLSR
jgi:tRNA threonylcarbamoyladenosine biosynthesis protein TsaB